VKDLNWRIWQVPYYSFLCCLLCCTISVQAQLYPVLRSQHRLGSNGEDTPKAIVAETEGNLYILATVSGKGKQVSEQHGCTDIWLACLKSDASLQWEKSFGGIYCDDAYALRINQDNLWVSGSTASFLSHPESADRFRSSDAFLLSVRKDGTLNSYQVYGAEEKDHGMDILPLSAEMLIQTGYSFSNLNLSPGKAGLSDIWVRKVTSDTTQTFPAFSAGGAGYDWPVNLLPLSSGEIILTANTAHLNSNLTAEAYPKPWVIVFDTALKKKKSFIPQTTSPVTVTCSAMGPNQTLALAGYAIRQDADPQFWFMICDLNGKVFFEKIWGGSGAEYISSLAPCKDGGWILTGWSAYYNLENPNIKGGEDLWVIRYNPQQEIEWAKTWGGPGDERGVAVIEYIPGVYYILGQRGEIQESENRDLWLLRIEEEECELPDITPTCKYPGLEPRIGQYLQFALPTTERLTCLWDFGDGTSSKELNPMKKYYRVGLYEVKVTYRASQACERKVVFPEKINIK